jgi:hypothetical protein
MHGLGRVKVAMVNLLEMLIERVLVEDVLVEIHLVWHHLLLLVHHVHLLTCQLLLV